MTHWPRLPDNPKISVVTVSFNQGEFIRQNIESVLAQNYLNFEHIVVDGGSTDRTVEILRSYPHLKWTSERDRNQSDGLNKGFARATGDIIVWLNSDDWLAPDIFRDIARELQDYPVLLTEAAETDRFGTVKRVVANEPRGFHDLLRYWVPMAWLAQVGVFFRRSLLEEVKRGPGEYLDESLNLTMDVDLWFRMARRAPFSRHLKKTCAYFRMYEENKTGKSPLSAQKECGRIYRRCLNELCRAERRLTFVMPMSRLNRDMVTTFQSMMQQTVTNFDLLIVDHSSSKKEREGIESILDEVEKSVNMIGVRCLRLPGATALQALNHGLLQANSPLVANIWPGDTLAKDYVQEAINTFSVDPTGLAIPTRNRPDLRKNTAG